MSGPPLPLKILPKAAKDIKQILKYTQSVWGAEQRGKWFFYTTPVKKGDHIEGTYADKQFEVIVIDSDGLGAGQPSYGFGFMMAAKYIGIPQPTLTKGVIQNQGVSDLKTPSGKTFRVIHLLGNDGNNYSVIDPCPR